MRRLLFGLFLFAACGTAAAQNPPPGLPTPRLYLVFPTGCKAGAIAPEVQFFSLKFKFEQELTVTGFDLDEPEKLVFSHPDIKAEFLPPPVPPVDPKKKATPPKVDPKGPYQFKVTVPASVPPGTYDVRFVGKYGMSNPRAFVVGNLDEAYEAEPNNDVPEAQRVAIGTTINGVIANQTDVDYSVFTGKKGQRVVLACRATSIDSRANPLIEVFNSEGRKVASNRNYRDGDAVADAFLPADGDYYVRLSQFAYQGGGPEYVYRLTISAGPWIDAVFPPAIAPGKPAQVTLYGRNLPNSQPANGYRIDDQPLEMLTVTVNPPTDAAALTRLMVHDRIDPRAGLHDGFEYVFKGPNGVSNPVPIYFAREKLVVKKNVGGSTAATAELIPAPCEVAGFIARQGDNDWYAFEAKKGEQYLVEVAAEQIGNQGDFFFSIRDSKDSNRNLSGEQDDDNESLHPFGFYTRTGDPPAFKFTAPEDGKYLVLLGCRESSVLYGPETAYRLRVSPAKPDFRTVAMPYSRHYQGGANGWQGGTQAYDVYVHRIDGYSGPVTITAEKLPGGVTAKPLIIGPGARWGVLVLNIAANAAPFTGSFTLKASGPDSAGKPLVRDVRPASVTWGNPQPNSNVPALARLDIATGLPLAILPEKAFFNLTADVAAATAKVNNKDEKLSAPLTVAQGTKFTVPLKVKWNVPDKQNVILTAEPISTNPQNSPITVQIGGQPTKDKPEAVLNFDVKANAAPGVYAITVKGVAQVPYARPVAGGAMGKGQNVPVEEFAEPIQVIVLPTSLAKVTVGNLPNNSLKLGMSGELTVKVERQYDYAGEFKVKFELPKGATGVTAAEVTIPAGKDEAKLVLKAAADAKPGGISNAIVTVSTLYDNKHPITHEAKVNFTVVK